MEEKKRITVTQVLDMLKQGKTRPEIGQYFGLTPTEVKNLFQHPKLKNKKTIKQNSFLLVDDTEESTQKDPSETEEQSMQENIDLVSENEDYDDVNPESHW